MFSKMAASRKVYVVGVGMTKFVKPGSKPGWDYPEMALEAGQKALGDAGIDFNLVEQACVGYVYGDTTCGQRAVYQLGMTGIPVYNVNNACATGSTALMMARQLIEGGLSDCVLALGFEKMERRLEMKFTDRTLPMDKHLTAFSEVADMTGAPMTAQLFGEAGLEHMKKYGTPADTFVKIAHKNHKHSVNNPYSQHQKLYSVKEIEDSPMISYPLNKLACCPTSDGAGAAILASEDFVRAHGLQNQAIEILAQSMATDLPSTFRSGSPMKIVGYDVTKRAAAQAYQKAGIEPDAVDVVELHDCFASNELISYEALGLCPEGCGGEFVANGDNTYGGKYVVNPSGGLISKGHPLGATGLAQCAEICWQLRGLAEKRQVAGARIGLQHNLGLGGAAVVTLYRHGFPEACSRTSHSIQMSPTSSAPNPKDFKSAVVFDEITKQLSQDGAKYVKKINGVFRFEVKGGPGGSQGVWIVDVKNGNGQVKYDPEGKGDVTVSMSDDDLLKLMAGQLNPQQAFFQGKLKIKGNMSIAMKLRELQMKPKAKL